MFLVLVVGAVFAALLSPVHGASCPPSDVEEYNYDFKITFDGLDRPCSNYWKSVFASTVEEKMTTQMQEMGFVGVKNKVCRTSNRRNLAAGLKQPRKLKWGGRFSYFGSGKCAYCPFDNYDKRDRRHRLLWNKKPTKTSKAKWKKRTRKWTKKPTRRTMKKPTKKPTTKLIKKPTTRKWTKKPTKGAAARQPSSFRRAPTDPPRSGPSPRPTTTRTATPFSARAPDGRPIYGNKIGLVVPQKCTRRSKKTEYQDFQDPDDKEIGWATFKNGKRQTRTWMETSRFSRFIGIKRGEFLTRSILLRPDTDKLVVEFDLYEIDNWNNDLLQIEINKVTIDVGRFSSWKDEGTLRGYSTEGEIEWSLTSKDSPHHRGYDTSYKDQRHRFAATLPRSDHRLYVYVKPQLSRSNAIAGFDNFSLREFRTCKPFESFYDFESVAARRTEASIEHLLYTLYHYRDGHCLENSYPDVRVELTKSSNFGC